MITEAQLTGTKGTINARQGDEFPWWDGTIWRIEGFTGNSTYSPSSIGGCPVVLCKHLSGDLTAYKEYMENGSCEWCGDSVASALITARDRVRKMDEMLFHGDSK